MPVDINVASVQYQRIKQNIMSKVISGEYAAGERIPSERELCEIFSLSRTTIRRAIDELVAEGILFRVPAKGTYVAHNHSPNKYKTGNIAFIRCYRRDPLSSINDDIFYPRILTGVETTISQNGYHCLVQSINENDFSDQGLALLTQKVDGMICCELRNRRLLERLRSTQLPLVLVSPSVELNTVDVVEISNREGALEAVNYLTNLGHKDIAFIGGSPNSTPSRERQTGYTEALEQEGLPVLAERMISLGWRQADGCEAMNRLLKMRPVPTAVFAASDLLALGAYDAADEAGVRIPEDISVMGFDDIDMAAQAKPRLSTVLVRKMEIGQLAAQLILEQLGGDRDYPLKIVVPTVLVQRESAADIRVLAATTR